MRLLFIRFSAIGDIVFASASFRYAKKQLPRESLKQLVMLIPQPIVLIGGPEEKIDAEELALVDSDRIINTCGTYSLHESAVLVRDARGGHFT
jgi:ADP-heptose:LPS heptosyltransferase